jgi:hypothetical protein
MKPGDHFIGSRVETIALSTARTSNDTTKCAATIAASQADTTYARQQHVEHRHDVALMRGAGSTAFNMYSPPTRNPPVAADRTCSFFTTAAAGGRDVKSCVDLTHSEYGAPAPPRNGSAGNCAEPS